jgi:hypothetical protein
LADREREERSEKEEERKGRDEEKVGIYWSTLEALFTITVVDEIRCLDTVSSYWTP